MGSTTSSLAQAARFVDDGVETRTSRDQIETEDSLALYIKSREEYSESALSDLAASGLLDDEYRPVLQRAKHVSYLRKGLSHLPAGYACLDASRPWLCYWIIHALALLDAPPTDCFSRCVDTLKRCQHPDGGFGGGPAQNAHTAPTYASVLALFTCGNEAAYDSIDRPALYRFFMRCKDAKVGAFRVEGKDGEVDTRGLYTVLAVSSMLNMLTPELVEGVAEFVGRCQTYEGGIGGFPGNEAHGGYSFCGLAALVILDRFDVIDVEAFAHWIVTKQMRFEGGYQGRTNKLVDACYSFWQGAIPALLMHAKGSWECEVPLQDSMRLQEYIVLACQQREGGLRDKPGKSRDYYHTCYALSGLSVAQHVGEGECVVFGAPGNLLQKTDPVYNVRADKLEKGMAYFKERPARHEDLMKV